ncbi:hypothetical protein FMUND_6437 [Fusarium mundagurra]|uniref:Uncharacterized protein n=1 Tax=Fusarium mundagurra TaxID=1567541 RepID=A0A8H5YPA1_9HYPO|nr:hypothetical protein FMUND_6437 [Fusarium mundagurra]
MSAVVDAAIAKTEALRTLVEQWTLEISEIKSPEKEYTAKRQALLSTYHDELRQVQQNSDDTNEFSRRSDAILQLAGEIRELEIQFQTSASLLEQRFRGRLEAANKRLACGLFQGLGDTLWDHSVSTVLNQYLRPKTPINDGCSAEEESTVVLEARTDPYTELDVALEASAGLDADQSQISLPIASCSENQDRDLAQTSAFREVRAWAPGETLSQHQSAAHQTPPAQERDSASQSNLVTEGQDVTSPLAAQAPTPSPTTESSRVSDNVVDSQEKSNSIVIPASETNLDQNGGTVRWGMWHTSQTQNESVLSAIEVENQYNTSPGQESTDSLVVHLHAPLKRLQPQVSNRKQKRQKLPIACPEIPAERVIDFDQVFQDGNAQTKYIIVQHPPDFGHWYILECKEHNKHFYKDPTRGASRHLKGQEHGLSGEDSFAVKMLGTRVLHCNEKLAAKNNRVTRQAFLQVVIPGNRAREDQTQNIEILPVVGEIYAAKFPKNRHTYAVLVLPWTAFDHFPFMKQLLRDTPSCYLFDKAVDKYPRGWAMDFEDGGRRVKDRVYPVVFFHKENFPQQCDIGWLPLTSFKVYDPEHTGVVCSKIVDRYLQNKDPRLAANHGLSAHNTIVIPDGDDGGDADMGNYTEHGNGEMSCNASRNENSLRIKDEQVGQLQLENCTVDPRALYTSASQGNGVDASQSHIHTQDPCTSSGPTVRIEYPFVSGGSEDMRRAESRATIHAAALTSKQPIGSVVELGEIHAESTNSARSDPQRFNAHSLHSVRPPQDEDTEAIEAETREALLALGPDISSHIQYDWDYLDDTEHDVKLYFLF